jgi:hypothetical protein
VVWKRVSGPLYIKGRAGQFCGRGFDRASVTASQQAFQVASAMEDAENKYLLLLLLEFTEEQMFWESGKRNASYIMKLCRLEVA